MSRLSRRRDIGLAQLGVEEIDETGDNEKDRHKPQDEEIAVLGKGQQILQGLDIQQAKISPAHNHEHQGITGGHDQDTRQEGRNLPLGIEEASGQTSQAACQCSCQRS
jgi:hypothetical protein